MRCFILALITLTLSGCATTERYHTKLNTWIGLPADNLVNSWGIPSRVYKGDNGGLIEYFVESGQTVSVQNIGNMTYVNSGSWWCKTTFNVTGSGVISNWQTSGNSCVSY